MLSPFLSFFSPLFFFRLFHFALVLSSLLFSADFSPRQAALFVAVLISIFNILFSTSGVVFCATNRRLLENGRLRAGSAHGCRRDDKGCGSRAPPSLAVEDPGDAAREGN